jgi:hypothetical protein
MNDVRDDIMAGRVSLDQRVPPKIERLAFYYHNLIYIKYYWETIGQQVDPRFVKEMQRAHDELIEEIEQEQGQGGLLRREKK